MYNFSLFEHYFLTKNSFNQTTMKETKLFSPVDNNTTLHVENIPYLPLLFSTIFLIIIWRIAAFIIPLNVLKIPKIKNSKAVSNRFKQVPCRKCQFFDDNHYLHCAVRPSIALTKQALDCSDYLFKNSTIEVKTRAPKPQR
jgi:hypothetical protein